jgi:hypothetical protein
VSPEPNSDTTWPDQMTTKRGKPLASSLNSASP